MAANRSKSVGQASSEVLEAAPGRMPKVRAPDSPVVFWGGLGGAVLAGLLVFNGMNTARGARVAGVAVGAVGVERERSILACECEVAGAIGRGVRAGGHVDARHTEHRRAVRALRVRAAVEFGVQLPDGDKLDVRKCPISVKADFAETKAQ